MSLYILDKLSAEDARKIFKTAYLLMLLTACVHIALQVTDYRPAMTAAYWFSPENGDFDDSWFNAQIDHDTFVRGLPQGINLILFFTLLKLSECVLGRDRVGIRNLIAVVILFAAVFIIASRSLMIVLGLGVAVLIGLAAMTLRANAGHVVRIGTILSLFVGAALMYEALRPGFFELWSERIALFESVDSKIFSEENRARGLDNLAALKTIRDNLIVGVGMPYIPGEYSLKDEPSPDIHQMLEIGLVGGVPAILLVIALQVQLFVPYLKKALSHPPDANVLVPFLSVLIMSTFALNTSGGGGTLIGPPILFVTIFANEMWKRCPPASEADKRRSGKPRTNRNDATKFTPHYSHNALL